MNENFIKVRRLKSDCCGMEVGKIYLAQVVYGWSACYNEPSQIHYVRIKKDDGSWTSEHWFNGWFEVISERT